MQQTKTPPISSFLPTAIFLALAGWGGLAAMIFIYEIPPTLWPRWFFFFLSVLAVTGTVLPVFAFLNRRFSTHPAASTEVVVREALWIGIYIPTLAWLQIPRVLTPAIALLLMGGLILIEWLLRMRDRSQWKP